MKVHLPIAGASQAQTIASTTLNRTTYPFLVIKKIAIVLMLLCGIWMPLATASTAEKRPIAQPITYSAVKVPSRKREVPIPADGNCLYTTIMMTYLFPVANDSKLFTNRLIKLIGEDKVIHSEETKDNQDNDSKNDNKFTEVNLWNAYQLQQYFLQLRRCNLIFNLRLYPFSTLVRDFKQHINLCNNDLWGGPKEIKQIADHLQVTIEEYVPDPEDQKKLTEPMKIQCKQGNPLLTLRIVQDNPTDEESIDMFQSFNMQIAQQASAQESLHYQHYRALLLNTNLDKQYPIFDPYASQIIKNSTINALYYQKEGSIIVKTDNAHNKQSKVNKELSLQHQNSLHAVAYSSNSRWIAAGCNDSNVYIWDAQTSQCISTCRGHKKAVYSVGWSQNSNRLASTSLDNNIYIWNPLAQKHIATLQGHQAPVYSVAWSKNNERIASASDDKTIHMWDVETRKNIAILKGHRNSVYSVNWSNNTSLASASYDNTVRIWDVRINKETTILNGHTDTVYSVAWSHDYTKLASASDDSTVYIWDIRTGKKIIILEDHTDAVYGVAWSYHDQYVASASWDNVIRIWETDTFKNIAICQGHQDYVNSVDWSSQNNKIISASSDNTVCVWNPINN